MKNIAFVLDHDLKHYRVPFFNKLVESGFKVTVYHSGNIVKNKSFDQVKVKSYNLLLFEYRRINSLSNFDIVVFMQNLRILNIYYFTLRPFKKFKLIHWGIGVSSSNGLPTNFRISTLIRNVLSILSDATIFYSEYPSKFYLKALQKKLFVAPNSVDNSRRGDNSSNTKKYFLFIGTLSKRKGLEFLLKAFKSYLNVSDGKNIKKLVIVGDGPLLDKLKKEVIDLGINRSVEFKGRINSESKKAALFKNAAISISPFQAGLSVLESFSFGVPFMTVKDPISGGEYLNIINGKNGYLLNRSVKEFVAKMEVLDKNPSLCERLGKYAYKTYSNNDMENMVKRFLQAFEFVNQKNKKR